MEIKQVTAELDQMRELFAKRKPHRVLEIGCLDGGTLREWLLPGPEVVVAVDLDHRNVEAYEEWRSPHTQLHVLTGSSQDHEIMAQIRALGPYDWAFIDGDHDEEPVRSDVDLCLSCTDGLVLMHDIVPGPDLPLPGPGIVLEDLRKKYRVRQIVEDPGEWPWAHGVGIVER